MNILRWVAAAAWFAMGWRIRWLRKEISRQEANALRKQLKEKGLKSFGTPKKPGFYEKIEDDEEEEEELDFEEEIEEEE